MEMDVSGVRGLKKTGGWEDGVNSQYFMKKLFFLQFCVYSAISEQREARSGQRTTGTWQMNFQPVPWYRSCVYHPNLMNGGK
jgi:hypothetical protein